MINSLAPGRFQRNFRKVIFQLILVIDGWSVSCKIVLKWMPMDLTEGKSTLVQVMSWCRQATSHYLSQCWSRSLSPYGVIRPQWVKAEQTLKTQQTPHILPSLWAIGCVLQILRKILTDSQHHCTVLRNSTLPEKVIWGPTEMTLVLQVWELNI